MTKLEEVARAIAVCRGLAWQWDIEKCGYRAHYRVIARAAIEALREPTEAMQLAGARTDVGVAYTIDHRERCLAPGLIWRAMIDSILSEKPVDTHG